MRHPPSFCIEEHCCYGEEERMKLSLEPDPHMRWIYDYTHPDYNSDRAKDLRARRDAAFRSAPQWMIEEARMNDNLRALSTSKESK